MLSHRAPLASGVDTVHGSDAATGADRGRSSQYLCLHQPRTAASFRSIPFQTHPRCGSLCHFVKGCRVQAAQLKYKKNKSKNTPCKISTIVNTTCFKNVKVFICFKKKCLVLVAYCFKKCLKCSVDFPVGEQMPELPPAHGHCNFVGKTWK